MRPKRLRRIEMKRCFLPMEPSFGRDGFIVGFWDKVFGGLRWLSVFSLVRKLIPRRARSYWFVDAWVLSNFISAMVVWAMFSAFPFWLAWVCIGYGILRVLEIVVYQVNVLLFDPIRARRNKKPYAVRGYRRLLLLSLHNYAEVALWFACFYRHAGNLGHCRACAKTAVEFLYFSLATISTVGYGDIHPLDDNSRVLAIAEMGIGLFMGLIILARIVSCLPNAPSLEERDE